MAHRDDIVAFCDRLLDPAAFEDYCPNGLQVEGRESVSLIVSGVTASQALIEAAVAREADLLLVHHGYFWRGEAQPLVGMKGRRVRRLMSAGVNLLAYHLPLDAHPDLGNNRQLGDRLGFAGAALVDGLLWGVTLESAISDGDLVQRVSEVLGRVPQCVGPATDAHRVAWCTGGAQGMLGEAAALGFDTYISGEISEQTMHQANELGVRYIGAGHHATERYGVQALGEALAGHFGIRHEFVDLDNPA